MSKGDVAPRLPLYCSIVLDQRTTGSYLHMCVTIYVHNTVPGLQTGGINKAPFRFWECIEECPPKVPESILEMPSWSHTPRREIPICASKW